MLNAEKYKEQIEKVDYEVTIHKGDVKGLIKWLLSEATEDILDSKGNILEIGDLCKFYDKKNEGANIGVLAIYEKDALCPYIQFGGSFWLHCEKITAEEAKEFVLEVISGRGAVDEVD